MYTASWVQETVRGMKAEGVSRADMIRYLTGYCQGWGYVFGAAGEMCTPANRKKYASYRPDHAEAIRGACQALSKSLPLAGEGGRRSLTDEVACDGCARVDTRIFDCRGFTRWLLAQASVPLFGGTVTAQWEYGPNWVLKGDIRDMPRGLVCCVFRPSHTGMYVTDDTVRHCGGRKGQVVEEQLPGSPKWERFGIPAGLYTNAELEAAGVKFDPAKNIPTLRKGSQGDEVADLQMLLSAKYGADLDIDGVFGAKTEAAVKAFQKAHGLTADGVVGPKTRAALGVSESLPLEGGRSARESVQWTDSSEGRAAAPDGGAPLGATDEVTLPSVIPSEAERERSGVEGSESSTVSQAGMITLPLSDWQSIRAAVLAAYHILKNYE